MAAQGWFAVLDRTRLTGPLTAVFSLDRRYLYPFPLREEARRARRMTSRGGKRPRAAGAKLRLPHHMGGALPSEGHAGMSLVKFYEQAYLPNRRIRKPSLEGSSCLHKNRNELTRRHGEHKD